MKNTILVLTALELEKTAIEFHLQDIETIFHPETNTDYAKGLFPIKGQNIEVIVGRTNQTNINAALETERALSLFNPRYVFFAGVAGGLKDVNVGDVVIGADVYGYERGKAEEGKFKPRPQFGSSSYDLERFASSYAASENWKSKSRELLDTTFAPEIKTYTGTIASGEKVDASIKSELHGFLKQNASHALAIEMEGLGFLEVCRMRPAIKSLLLRGISDLVGDKGEMDGKGSQPYASQNVAAFLFGVVDALITTFPEVVEENIDQQLLEIMCKLYPGGMKDQGIWETTGGSLSLINLNQSGKGQWVEALRNMKNGGIVTFSKLLEAVLVDHPLNQDVKKLALNVKK